MRKLVVLLLALTTMVQGYDVMANRCWEVGGEALFWRACGKSYDYGMSQVAPTTFQSLSVKPGYDVGFRIWGGTYTHDCCHLFDIDWTHLRTFDKQRATGNILIFPDGQQQAGTVANSSVKFGYDKAMVRAGRYIARYCKSMAWVYGGAGYLNLQRDQQVIAVDTAGGSRKGVDRATYEGGLLEVGVGADVEEPYCIHLLGHIGALVGIGQRRLSQTFLTGGNLFTILHPEETSCIAGLQMRLGVQWRYEVCCTWIMLQVSYQLDQYFDVLRLPRSQPAQGPPPAGLQSVGFSGPSVSASIRF